MNEPPCATLIDKRGQVCALRRVTARDLEAILKVASSAHRAPWSREIFERELELEQGLTWGVVAPHGELIATLICWLVLDEIQVMDLAVRRDHQGAGLGSALMRQLELFGRQRGASQITLEAREHNVAALALYQRAGFAIVGRRPRYYTDSGEAAVLMTRDLA